MIVMNDFFNMGNIKHVNHFTFSVEFFADFIKCILDNFILINSYIYALVFLHFYGNVINMPN